MAENFETITNSPLDEAGVQDRAEFGEKICLRYQDLHSKRKSSRGNTCHVTQPLDKVNQIKSLKF